MYGNCRFDFQHVSYIIFIFVGFLCCMCCEMHILLFPFSRTFSTANT
nr:MAG TPA: hypothetical protein [Caudoviricetes sp.]